MELISKIDKSFTFNNNKIRITGTNDNPLFVVSDICKILGISNVTDSIKNLPDKWKQICDIENFEVTSTARKILGMNCITEAGLYKIIMRSNKSIAQKFQEWICEEVLPSIRKTGEFKLKKILEDKEKEIKSLHKLVKRKERKKFKKNNSVYIISNPDIKNYLKIGKSRDLNKRLDSLSSGAPNQYNVEYYRSVCDAYEETAIELLLLSILDKYRVKNDTKGCKNREWIHDINIERVKNELDMLVDYIEERKYFHLEEKQYAKLIFIDEDNNIIKDNNKICYICNKLKNLDEYYNRKENIDGKEGTCKECYGINKKRLKEEKDQREIIIRKEGVKKCRLCNLVKDYECFYKHGSSKDGHEYACIDCKTKNQEKKSIKMCVKCRKNKNIIKFNKFRLGYNKYCKDCQPIEINTENIKKCSGCKEGLSIDNFSKSKTSSDGLHNYCKNCSKIKSKKNKQKNKQKEKIKILEKICIICNINKPVENYYKCITEKDGHKSKCKNCEKDNKKNIRLSLIT
jgi:prophage antirepressor-like protein